MSLKPLSSVLVLSTLLLGACNPNPAGPGPGSEQTLTLSGTLPTGGKTARVTVQGLPPVTTDTQGRFRVSGVQIPYTIRVDVPAYLREGETTAVIVEDLTSSDLAALSSLVQSQFPPESTPTPTPAPQVKGRVIGTLNPFLDANVYLTSTTNSVSGGQRVNRDFSFEYPVAGLYYDAVPKGPGTLHALQSSGNYTDLVQNYTAYGKRSVALPTSGALEGQDIALSPITTQTVRLRATLPVGARPEIYVSTGFRTVSTEGGITLGRGSVKPETGVTVPVSLPVVAGADYVFTLSASEDSTGPLYRSSNTGRILQTLPQTLELRPLPFLEWLSPGVGQDLAAAVVTVLRWGDGGGLTLLTLDESDTLDGFSRRRLFTTVLQKSRFSLADQGFTLKPNTRYDVQLIRIGGLPYASALAFASSNAPAARSWEAGATDVQYVNLSFKTQP